MLTLELRNEMDEMKKQVRDLLQVITESYTTSKTLQN